MSVAGVSKFLLASEAATGLGALFRARGAEGLELAALLAGVSRSDGVFLIDTVAVPRQWGEPVEYGCSLAIPGSELSRLGEAMRGLNRVMCGQIHSHPAEAFHSPADDANLFARFDGGISIVVPFFGRQSVLGPHTAVFRFDASKSEWERARRPTDLVTIGPQVEVTWLD